MVLFTLDISPRGFDFDTTKRSRININVIPYLYSSYFPLITWNFGRITNKLFLVHGN